MQNRILLTMWLLCALLSFSIAFAVVVDGQPLMPSFVSPISNVTTVEGDDVTFDCIIDNLGDYEVRWVHVDDELNHHVLTSSTHVISKIERIDVYHYHRTWSLDIYDIEPEDNGTYVCQISTNPVMSNAVYLEIIAEEKPSFVSPISNVTKAEGSNVTFECIIDNLGDYTVLWFHVVDEFTRQMLTANTYVLTRDRRISVFNNHRTWSLHLYDIQLGDNGTYVCQISTLPVMNNTGYLEIVVDDQSLMPSFVSPISNLTKTRGSDATFECIIDNLGDYVVVWVHVVDESRRQVLTVNTHVISRNGRVSVSHNQRKWSLHIYDIHLVDNGTYMCQISTDPVMSNVGYLEIVADDQTLLPSFVSPISNVTKTSGSDVTFECIIDNIGDYVVLWVHVVDVFRRQVLSADTHVISRSGRVSVSHNHRTWSLHIYNIQLGDNGIYMCQISTDPVMRNVGYLKIIDDV